MTIPGKRGTDALKRSSQSGTAHQKLWFRVYRERMNLGLEFCRACQRPQRVGNPLTFGHLKPHVDGGRYVFKNVTILCQKCNRKQGDTVWHKLVSLAWEEHCAPPNRRWSVLANHWKQQNETWLAEQRYYS